MVMSMTGTICAAERTRFSIPDRITEEAIRDAGRVFMTQTGYANRMLPSDAPSLVPPARGEWSDLVSRISRGEAVGPLPPLPEDPLTDDDLQLALYLCYELHYRGLENVPDALEWDPGLLAVRGQMEGAFEAALLGAVPRSSVRPDEIAAVLRDLEERTSPLSVYMEREATLEHFREFVIHRSPYHLKEADPHTFALPRIGGGAKAAFAEIQADEYGGGKPDRIHARLFVKMMDALGLDTRNGAYLPVVPGTTLATVNLMSLFGLHRRWRGAAAGHLALFELGSPLPNRRYGAGLRRLGFGPEVTDFHDEHVEADAVHSMLAVYDLAARLAADEPALADDVLFGARALDFVEGTASGRLLAAWEAGISSLVDTAPVAVV